MGASQSAVSTEDFKNYLYGTVVPMLAPRLDAELSFKECSKITDEDKHVLPLVLEGTAPTDPSKVVEAYMNYYSNGREDAIDTYVNTHILDTEEHAKTFMKQLFGLLVNRNGVEASIRRLSTYPKDNRTPSVPASAAPVPVAPSVRTQRSVPQLQLRSHQPHLPPQLPPQYQSQPPSQYQSPSQLQPPQSPQSPQQPAATRVKGHGKLHRRLEHVAQAIDNEHAAWKAQQELEDRVQESFQPPSPAPAASAAVDVYDEASTQPEPESELDVNLGSGLDPTGRATPEVSS